MYDPAVMAEAIELEEMIIIESNSVKIEIHNAESVSLWSDRALEAIRKRFIDDEEKARFAAKKEAARIMADEAVRIREEEARIQLEDAVRIAAEKEIARKHVVPEKEDGISPYFYSTEACNTFRPDPSKHQSVYHALKEYSHMNILLDSMSSHDGYCKLIKGGNSNNDMSMYELFHLRTKIHCLGLAYSHAINCMTFCRIEVVVQIKIEK